MYRFLPLLPLVLFLSVGAAADTVFLKNGDRITGKVWNAARDYLLLETHYGIYRIPRNMIRKTRYRDLKKTPVVLHLQKSLKAQGFLRRVNAGGVRLLSGKTEVYFPWTRIRRLVFLPSGKK